LGLRPDNLPKLANQLLGGDGFENLLRPGVDHLKHDSVEFPIEIELRTPIGQAQAVEHLLRRDGFVPLLGNSVLPAFGVGCFDIGRNGNGLGRIREDRLVGRAVFDVSANGTD
jgi:hypothetical protein